jgi:hypothetical protein
MTRTTTTTANWTLDDGRVIALLTPRELALTLPGTRLVCIDGTELVVGQDTIDGDTRGGYLAYGRLVAAPRG